jgi:hypothetical protein
VIAAGLIAEMQQLLNRARVISETPAAQLGTISRRHPSSTPPPARAGITLQALHARFQAAIQSGSDSDAEQAISWAKRQLRLLTHGPARHPETVTQRNYRILIEHEGRHYTDVGDIEQLHFSTIWKLRVADGRDGIYGRHKT